MAQTKKRKAPSDHAKEFSLGHKKKGNDGNMWEIVENKNGVKRWKKLNFSKKFKIKTTKSKSQTKKSKTKTKTLKKIKSKSKKFQIENHNIILETNIINYPFSPGEKKKIKKYVKENIEEMGSADTGSIAFYLFVKSIKFENDNNLILNINIKYDFNGKKIRPKPKGKLTEKEIIKLCSYENLKKHIKWSLNEASFRAEPLKLGANVEFSISEKQIKSIKLKSEKVKVKTKKSKLKQTRKKKGILSFIGNIFGKKSKKKRTIHSSKIKINSVNDDSNKLNKNNEEYKEIKKKMKGYKSYLTHWNGDRPYLVYIKNNDVNIYKREKGVFTMDDDKSLYIDFVKHYNAKKVFVGFDSCKFDGSDLEVSRSDKKWSMGNTILLQMTKNKYVLIDSNITEFTIKDEITKFFAQIGRNDVPYPVALSKDNVYFMIDIEYVSKDLFPKIKEAEFEDGYSYLYGNKDEEYDNISKILNKNIKKIKKKTIDKSF